MQFSDYSAFRTSVLSLIEGDDIGSPSFSLNSLDLMIALGETRVYGGDEVVPGLRASTMLAPLSITPSAGVYTLPADLLELHELYFDAARPIEIVTTDKLRRLGTLTSTGNAVYAAQNGEKLEFWPSSTTGAVSGSYYVQQDPLATVTWVDADTFARYPECFIYAALAESMPFLGFDSRLPLWTAKFRTAMQSAMRNEEARVYGGSRLRVRAR